MKVSAQAKGCLQPMPKVLVSCRDANGGENALAVGYCGNCSYDPPMVMVGIVPTRHSYQMVRGSGCFVVNLASQDNKDLFDYMGSHSGRDVDKFRETGTKTVDAIKVNAPLIADCPVNIECTVVDSIRTGSHEMFIGKIEYVHADEDLIVDGKIDFCKIQLL